MYRPCDSGREGREGRDHLFRTSSERYHDLSYGSGYRCNQLHLMRAREAGRAAIFRLLPRHGEVTYLKIASAIPGIANRGPRGPGDRRSVCRGSRASAPGRASVPGVRASPTGAGTSPGPVPPKTGRCRPALRRGSVDWARPSRLQSSHVTRLGSRDGGQGGCERSPGGNRALGRIFTEVDAGHECRIFLRGRMQLRQNGDT
jgi:hypothetical protein